MVADGSMTPLLTLLKKVWKDWNVSVQDQLCPVLSRFDPRFGVSASGDSTTRGGAGAESGSGQLRSEFVA
jgi:hypothetical protein